MLPKRNPLETRHNPEQTVHPPSLVSSAFRRKHAQQRPAWILVKRCAKVFVTADADRYATPHTSTDPLFSPRMHGTTRKMPHSSGWACPPRPRFFYPSTSRGNSDVTFLFDAGLTLFPFYFYPVVSFVCDSSTLVLSPLYTRPLPCTLRPSRQPPLPLSGLATPRNSPFPTAHPVRGLGLP